MAPARETRLALLLALLAATRVLVFSLAFPFFTNVDEYRHVDVVLKYARGYWPSFGPDHYEPETPRLVGALGSPEYHRDPESPAAVPPPGWQISDVEREGRVARLEAYLAPRYSLEADQPPVYYASAGAWLAFGRALGLRDLALLYWVRLLGAGAAFALVWAAWWLLRDVYPENAFVRLGVPLLLASLPQDALYYVTGDVFAPLLGGVAFLWVLRLTLRPDASAAAWLAGGLALAAGFLAKYPAAAVAAAAAVCTAHALRAADGRSAGRWLLYWAAFLLPALGWLGGNLAAGGDLTGTAFKVERLGWERKPLSLWLDHPIFTPSGLWIFARDLTTTFWRGEIVWARTELAAPAADFLYRVSSFVFVTAALLGLGRGGRPAAQRLAESGALAAGATAVALLAFLSLLFTFGADTSPSVSYPFFVQGRLISAVLLPFALLYVRGIDEAARRLPPAWRARASWGVLGLVCAVCWTSELWLTRPVFLSAYNGFHLP